MEQVYFSDPEIYFTKFNLVTLKRRHLALNAIGKGWERLRPKGLVKGMIRGWLGKVRLVKFRLVLLVI